MFRNEETYKIEVGENGLAYSNALVKDLVNKDTDGDEIIDWEEGLYGLDPTKKETTPGIPDGVAIKKMKEAQGVSVETKNSEDVSVVENLTETEKFSRELFSTIATLNQNGAMDQSTIDKISGSLAEHVKNAPQRKIYTLSDIKILKDDSIPAITKYSDALESIHKKYPIKGDVLDIFQRFVTDENNVDSSVLVEFDPIIKQMQNSINAILLVSVPESLATLHLDFLNSTEKVIENLNDIQLYDKDAILAFSGMSQFGRNIVLLDSAGNTLTNTINKKLNN